MWLKQEQANILAAIRGPTASETEGIADVDWQIHLTTATRHSSKVNQQSATVVLQPKKTADREKIMFEVSRADVAMMLDKLAIID
jgi:hypothetical protein